MYNNQRGSVLLAALGVTVLVGMTTFFIASQVKSANDQQVLPRIRSNMVQAEVQLRNLANSPSTYTGCEAGHENCQLNQSAIAQLNKGMGPLAIEIRNAAFDVSSSTLVATIHSSYPKLQIQDRVVSEVVGAEVLQPGSFFCPDARPFFVGYDVNGSLKCQAVDATACPAGQFVSSIDPVTLKPNCSAAGKNVDCGSGQMITNFSWTGGANVSVSCATVPPPTFAPSMCYDGVCTSTPPVTPVTPVTKGPFCWVDEGTTGAGNGAHLCNLAGPCTVEGEFRGTKCIDGDTGALVISRVGCFTDPGPPNGCAVKANPASVACAPVGSQCTTGKNGGGCSVGNWIVEQSPAGGWMGYIGTSASAVNSEGTVVTGVLVSGNATVRCGTAPGNILIDSGGCFVSGTKVTMADGSKKSIEDVRVGEVVQTFDEVNGAMTRSPVIETLHHPAAVNELFAFEFAGGGSVISNDIHPFYVANLRRYVAAKEIFERWQNHERITIFDEQERVREVTVITVEKQRVPVYNLHVRSRYDRSDRASHYGHNYFANGILVHNYKCPAPGLGFSTFNDCCTENSGYTKNLGDNVGRCYTDDVNQVGSIRTSLNACYATRMTGHSECD